MTQKLHPAIRHVNATPEFFNNPESVAMLNKMVDRAVTMRICDTCGSKWFDSGSCPNCNPQTEEDKK